MERGARRSILLVLVVRLDYLDVVAGELVGEVPHHLAQQVYPDAHVRGEYDGYALRRFFYLRELFLIESGSSDDDRLAIGEVSDGRLGGAELYEDFSLSRRVFGYADTQLPHAAELAEVGT